ncbi:DUF599 domain-containing protein [Caenimonas aquaedulcis]|uniref:DUF599 domain-containing protein n=1 Tax=Caenimonas aquaedulcis TaxID=2793270 RepID=A0A931H7V8_9BURK|nr:DUF599 domain-containing protein [Caenimonas aquaedulcis]MBG9390236.1 DUF599 domain-containing protein [Caenimonas aquaedulcis]
MSAGETWLAALLTVGIAGLYEAWFALARRARPAHLARSAHAALREDWFDAVSTERGTEILAVQTLRNSLMSASMTASTAVLGLMGTLTLSAPSLSAREVTPRLVLELGVLVLLFAALVSAAMAVRFYNHAGFIAGMPVDCEARRRWHATGRSHVRRAGVLYSWSLRHLLLVAPAVAFLLHPGAGPVAAAGVVAVLRSFDGVPAGESGQV